LKGDPPVTL